MNLDLRLDSYHTHLKFSKKENKIKLYDPIRKKHYVNQPEEVVRQLIIQYLILEKEISPNSIAVEKQIHVMGMEKRFDLLIYNKKMEPRILIECKAPSVHVDQKVVDQIALYNIDLKAPYLLVTNGIENLFFNIDFTSKRAIALKKIPDKATLLNQ